MKSTFPKTKKAKKKSLFYFFRFFRFFRFSFVSYIFFPIQKSQKETNKEKGKAKGKSKKKGKKKKKRMSSSFLTEKHLQDFKDDGYVVIENVLSLDEIQNCRTALHEYLQKYKKVNHEDLLSLSNNDTRLQLDVRKKGLTTNLFYSKFKMDVQLNEKMYETFKEICHSLDSTCTDVFPYIYRVAYRLPDHILPEGGLSLHIDRNPWTMEKAKKIRPVQAFVTLTDHFGSNCGGLRVVPKFHTRFDAYFSATKVPAKKKGGKPESIFENSENNEAGEFYRMHGKEHTSLQQQLVTVQAPAGSLVIWNTNLPHATCEKLESFDTREVIYLSYIPAHYKINRDYFEKQTECFLQNIAPPAYLKQTTCCQQRDVKKLSKTFKSKVSLSNVSLSNVRNEEEEKEQIENISVTDRDYDVHTLSEFQRQLLNLH